MANMNTERLHSLCKELLESNGTISQSLVEKLEALYEEALVALILQERQNAMDSLQKRVAERAATAAPATSSVKEKVEEAKKFGDEVKVLPHPEGPPKPTPRPTLPPPPAQEPTPEPVVEEKEEPKPAPVPEPKPKAPEPPREVVEALEQRTTDSKPGNRLQKINIGLNDRIAFVKQLFQGSQEDYQRVISQINTMDSYDETIDFIENVVKPDYDWADFEETEQRLLDLIANRFNR
ncbi:MAG: hypothetical protein HWD92_02140 [Flavobacteriia bacterium]|nr:hypothetical protein [Flavobacteriia bacterium]